MAAYRAASSLRDRVSTDRRVEAALAMSSDIERTRALQGIAVRDGKLAEAAKFGQVLAALVETERLREIEEAHRAHVADPTEPEIVQAIDEMTLEDAALWHRLLAERHSL